MKRTGTDTKLRHAAVAAGLLISLAGGASAQQQSTASAQVTIKPGAQYDASGLARVFLGSNWRDLWVTPVRVPVLDLGRFAGGLTPERQGGGNQSVTLHMVDESGTGWIFRSIDKFPANALPDDFRNTPVGWLVADQISALHPASHLIMPRLLDAVGILRPEPVLYVMPDDPRLGEFRSTFAGMLGEIEVKPDEGPDDTPGFAGSTKVKGSANFLDDLEDTPAYRVDAHEFLRARLVDMLVGDPDRGTDQWEWARFGPEGNQVYRPVPRDRDWAFFRGTGLVSMIGRRIYPKFSKFGAEYDAVETYTYGSHVLDRRLLTELTRSDFVDAAQTVAAALTDDVLAAAVRDMPPEFHALAADEMTADLRTRRASLLTMSLEFYDWLSGEVDVRGTDEDDIADIERRDDGSVRVRLSSSAAPVTNGGDGPGVYYDRVFLPRETNEVRVHLHGGDDRALVHGTGRGGIVVRVIGGGSDDVLEDRTGAARFYDHRGDNEFITAPGTGVDTKPWDPPEAPEGLRAGSHWAPDWGAERSLLSPAVSYSEAGLIIGAGPSMTRYGFRRLPYKWTASAQAQYAIGSGGFGVQADADYRFLNSRRAATLDARATQFDVFRFYGFGNDTPLLDSSLSRVLMDRVYVHPALAWHIGARPGGVRADDDAGDEDEEEEGEGGVQRPFEYERLPGPRGSFSIGPVLQWTRMRPVSDSPLADAPGTRFGQVGGRAQFRLEHLDRDAAPRRGYRVQADVSAFPAALDATSAFGRVSAHASAYVPLIGATHLAVRAGGVQTLGNDIPVFEAAFIGGRHTLRGFRHDRFAGEAAAYGGAELRVPLGTVRLLVNGEVGVFGLADAGRVFVAGESSGDWHTGVGGGLWVTALDRAVSIAYARGEQGRFYLWSGLPF